MTDDTSEDNIRSSLERIKETQLELIGHYFTRICSRFINLSSGQREEIVTSLESFANYRPFNYEEARKIREREGMSLRSLGEATGLSGQGLSNYEIGKDNPFTSPKTRKYIEWLISKGFGDKAETS